MTWKLVVFVPTESLDVVRDALFEAGAGRIERVPELRLETAHPYEEPALDLYPLL